MATFNTFIHRFVVTNESECINAIASNNVDSIRRIMQQMPSLLNRHFISDNEEIIMETPNDARRTRWRLALNPLLQACSLGNIDIVKELIRLGANVNARVWRVISRSEIINEDEDDEDEIYHTEIIKFDDFQLYQNRMSEWRSDYDNEHDVEEVGMTPLHLAVAYDYPELTQYLLSLPSVNPNLMNVLQYTPFYTSIRNDIRPLTIVFLDCERDDLNVSDGWYEFTPIVQACVNKLHDIVKRMLCSKHFRNYQPTVEEIEYCVYHDEEPHEQGDSERCARWVLFKIWSINPDYDASIHQFRPEFFTECKARFDQYKALFKQSAYSTPVLHLNNSMRTELQGLRNSANASSAAGSAQRRRVESQVSLNDVPVDPLRIVGQFAEIPNRYSYKLFLFCADQEEDNDDTLAENSSGDRN